MVNDHSDKRKEGSVFYLMTHSTHFIYGYMMPDLTLTTTQIPKGKKEMYFI